LACEILTKFPFELKKVASNSIDAAHSIVIPGKYTNIHGEDVDIDPKRLEPSTEVISF